ncbi:MAG: glycosyltransferase [Bacteroidota bacterium]
MEKGNNDKEIIIQQQRKKEDSLYAQLDGVNKKLNQIHESDGWKFLDQYYKLKGKILPENSKRYIYLKNAFNRLRGKKEVNFTNNPIINSVENSIPAQTKEAYDSPIYDVVEFNTFENPVVSIIIPVFNGWTMTYRCLKSIRKNTISIAYEVIIADDGATDETKNIKEYIKNITVIRNKENLGFLNNCNNASKSVNGKFILFLNNDTEVQPGWLSSLVELMEKDKSIGMTGSKFIYPDGRLQEAGGIIWNDASGWISK